MTGMLNTDDDTRSCIVSSLVVALVAVVVVFLTDSPFERGGHAPLQ
jgi:hypothetical protein